VNQSLTQPATSGPNWWQRNWKWFVPVGCFTMALLFFVFIGSILLIVFSGMKSTDVYKEALARAKADPAVIEALGLPIENGFLVSGNTNVNGASGESNLAIPISGPKGKGTIYVSATKSLGQWNYSGLVVETGQKHERIDLLQRSAPSN
jgi:Cytochrome oxidase complex assembly protein 1